MLISYLKRLSSDMLFLALLEEDVLEKSFKKNDSIFKTFFFIIAQNGLEMLR